MDQVTKAPIIFPVQKGNIEGREFIKLFDWFVLSRFEGEPDFAVYIDGLELPNVRLSQNDHGEWYASVARGFGFGLGVQNPEYLFAIFHMLATSMAVAAGFSSFGEHSTPINPYKKHPGPAAYNPDVAGVNQALDYGTERAGEVFGVPVVDAKIPGIDTPDGATIGRVIPDGWDRPAKDSTDRE